MIAQIVNVEPSKLDDDCMIVTLRHVPTTMEKWLGKEESLITYKGHGSHWYQVPCFSPAHSKVQKLLKSIYRGWEFRHIQFQYRRQLRKAG